MLSSRKEPFDDPSQWCFLQRRSTRTLITLTGFASGSFSSRYSSQLLRSNLFTVTLFSFPRFGRGSHSDSNYHSEGLTLRGHSLRRLETSILPALPAKALCNA